MAPSDDHFGPQVPGVFDFTILFEQSILSLLPTALFIVIAPLRVFPLLSREKRVRPGPLLWAKLTLAAVFAALQVALVALWATSSAHRTRTSIAEPAIAIVEALVIGALSYLEHVKSHRPSIILGSYLVISVILDIALARTFWIRERMDAIAAVFTVSLVTKAALLVLEETPKRAAFIDNKDISCERSSGVISRSVFWWLNRLFWHASRNLITVDDLGTINEKFDSDTLVTVLETKWKNTPKDSPVALFSCTFTAFKAQLAAGILPRLLFSGFSFSQPFLIESVIRFVGSPTDEWSARVASGLIGATVLIYVGLAVSTAWYKHASFQLVTMWRGGLVSLIFRKTLELDPAAVKENAPVTLMTTDMDTIVQSGEVIHELWGSLIDLPIGIWLLYRQVGYPGLFVLIPTLVTTVVSGALAPSVEPATVSWNSAVQKRVGHVSEMLGQIKGVKMMGLIDYFHTLLRGLRLDEIKASERLRWLIVYLTTLVTFAAESTPVIIIIAAIYWSLSNGALSIAQAFTSLSIIMLSVQPLTMLLASIIQFAGLFGCFMRIQTFLLLEEQKDIRLSSSTQTIKSDQSSQVALTPNAPRTVQPSEDVELSTLQTRDGADQTAVVLDSVSFIVQDGPQILSDVSMSIARGSLTMVVGRVGCGKSSLLKTIIGELAPQQGTITAIADTMAYCDQTPWLQNVSVQQNITVHSPLDEEWMWTVIRACALEEDISDFPSGVRTLVGSGGVALSGGQKQRLALARAVYARKSVIVIDDVFSGLDNRTSRSVFQALLGPNGLLRQSKTTIIMSTSNTHFLTAADFITMLEDGRIIRNQVTYDSLTPAEWGAIEKTETESSPEPEEDDEEEEQKRIIRQQSTTRSVEHGPTEADMARQTGDIECYKIYLSSLGWRVLTISFVLMVGHAVLEIMPQVWLRLWTEDGGTRDARYTGGYVGLVVASVILGTLDFGFFIIIAIPTSATYLHEKLLTSVCRAPLYFFTSTDSGSILNRFSQDMTLVDQMLPFAFQMTCNLALRALAQTGLIASGANYAAAGLPFGFIALYLVQKYYLRTSRQMRLLDLEMKTPLYTHFTETLAGVSTIRAFGWSPAFMDDSTRRLDTSQRPFYTMFCIQRWLHVVLDLFIAGMALLLVALALRVLGSTSQGAIGLALVNLLSFNVTLKYVIDSWTNLETSLGAIARLKWFMSATPDEHKEGEDGNPPADWPSEGTVEFENVTAAYSDAMSTVLQDVSFRIATGQKVCVCGRSGSGKSSLILSLLRLLELRSGAIRIDGIDLSTLPRQQIRSSLTTIPQDPVKITGTVRHNLDPEGKVQSEATYTEILRKTALWPVIESRGGLDADMSELGFSVGQQQLFSLARALLLRNKVVLLDESTSSVDGVTDKEIRRIVTHEMKDRTVIEVLHRLDVVEEFDLVIVMGHGRVLEAGPPRELLAGRSELRRLVENKGI